MQKFQSQVYGVGSEVEYMYTDTDRLLNPWA